MAALIIYCNRCREGYLISPRDKDAHLLDDTGEKFACPHFPACVGFLRPWTKGTPKFPVRRIGARDLWTASGGFGLPEERKCSGLEVIAALTGAKIAKVDAWSGDLSYKDRCVINSLTLEDGRTFHFAMSTKGAMIYKVTKEKKDGKRHRSR